MKIKFEYEVDNRDWEHLSGNVHFTEYLKGKAAIGLGNEMMKLTELQQIEQENRVTFHTEIHALSLSDYNKIIELLKSIATSYENISVIKSIMNIL